MSQSNILVRLSRALFGSLDWQPAPWMESLFANFKEKPLASSMALCSFLAALVSAIVGYHWYVDKPRPLTFNAEIKRPEIPSAHIEKTSPKTLWVHFSVDNESLKKARLRAEQHNEYDFVVPTSVLDIDKVHAESLDDISITPAVKGTWVSTANGLGFTPAKHWPANSTYTLEFKPSLFKPTIKLGQESYSFTTAALSVETNDSRLHSDPDAPSRQRYVSTLTFTHPVNIDSLKQKYQLAIQDSTAITGHVSLDYDLIEEQETGSRDSRVFYINSNDIDITGANRYLEINLVSGIRLKQFSHYLNPPDNETISSDLKLSSTVKIPSAENFFHVVSAQVQIVRDSDDNPQQAFLLELSDAAALESIESQFEAYLLPKKNPSNQHERWTSASEISPDIEQQSTLIQLNALPIEHQSSRQISFVFNAPENRQLLMKLKAGAVSAGGFVISTDYRAVVQIPEYPKELSFLGDGSVLDRSGSHKIGFVSRGVEQLRVSIGKIREDQIHHLISQTNGELTNPAFRRSLLPEDISVITEDTINLRQSFAGKPTYSSIDLSRYLDSDDKQTGLFHIDVYGIDQNGYERVQQQRLVLITNIGFLTKVNADRSQGVFVQSVDSGEPLGSATVSVLGKNGLTVWSTETDNLGYAEIENLDSFTRDKQPVAILVEKSGDMAYLPTANYTQQLNTSRFDTGGVYIDPHSEDDIRAFLFTDRGIYRPGETVKIGVIARAADLRPTQPFSVGLFISDPRGINVYEKQHRLTNDGFFETELNTLPHSVTGNYHGTLYLAENDEYTKHLGSFQFAVEEFQADRLKIVSSIDKEILNSRPDTNVSTNSMQGWLRPDEVNFHVELKNLFGTAAQYRRISGNYGLTPQAYRFADFPNYVFSDVIDPDSVLIPSRGGALADQTTDKFGNATFSPQLDAMFAGSYALTLNTEGFEENGGRSVRTQTTVRFSPRDYLIGFKANQRLDYVTAEDDASTELLCVNQYAQPQSCGNLRLQIVETTYISTLVKQNNGTYQYQTIEKDTLISDQPITLSEPGYKHIIDTSMPGNFRINLVDSKSKLRQSIPYRVVGTSNTNANLEKDAHLEIVLNQSEYQAGDWIELQLKAPYSGSGLITIESTSTHAFRWFKSDETQSVQRIQVPEGLRGNAYVQVSFIRAADSNEIFTSPLSYAISPFYVDRKDHQLKLSLQVASEVEPGHKLSVTAKSDQPAKAIVFAVDEGVLQVANYQTPRPLEFFLQKRALQVQTYQMFDLLLPEFELLKELSAAGGGMAEMDSQSNSAISKNLNPFSRKVKDPVAFWSGIVDIGPESTEITFDIPDHFDGTLRVMAIGLSKTRFGHAEESVIVKGPFVVSPNAPLVVAPGDTFSVTVGVSNQRKDSGPSAEISVIATVSEHLNVVGESQKKLTIAEGDETTVTYRLVATEKLGSADLEIVASATSNPTVHNRRSSTSISVRPAMPLTSSITSGKQSNGTTFIPIKRELLEDRSQSRLYVSSDPTLMINGLISYLDVYPHACTEQIVSQASPILAYLDHPNFLGTPEFKRENLKSLFQSLRSRQLGNGGLTLWPGGSSAAQVPTIHAVHMLIDAAEDGINLPPYLLDYGVQYLQQIGFDLSFMRSQPELAAHSLYLLTRMGEATNNGLIQLEEILKGDKQKDVGRWRSQLVAAYMASSYALLKRDRDATELIRQYKFKHARARINRYDSALYRDAMALYLLAKHFPAEIEPTDTSRIEAILAPILSGNINTLSSGRALLALKAYADTVDFKKSTFSVQSTNSEIDAENTHSWEPIDLQIDNQYSRYHRATLSRLSRALQIVSDSTVYYQITQKGFDRAVPAKPSTNGLEVSKSLFTEKGIPLSAPPKQGDDVIVKLKLRSSTNEHHDDIAITDLLPGGFEIDIPSARQTQRWSTEYIDIREDRVVFYGAVGPQPIEITYKARVTTAGQFTVPAAYANAMYDENTYGASAASSISVEPSH